MGRCYLDVKERKLLLAELWMQAVTEAAEDEEIRRYVRHHLREVHAFVSSAVRDAQERGVIVHERDAEAEAWIFVAMGLLATLGRRIGGVLGEEDLKRIRAARIQWMTGQAE
jgi:BetI-type transcriptional repressor, C-terminal